MRVITFMSIPTVLTVRLVVDGFLALYFVIRWKVDGRRCAYMGKRSRLRGCCRLTGGCWCSRRWRRRGGLAEKSEHFRAGFLLCLWLSHLHQHIELRHALHAMHGACNGMGSLVAVCLVDEEALPLLVSDM